jgi:hypothetical protein
MPADGEWGVVISQDAYQRFVAAVTELKRERLARRRELYRLRKGKK